MPLLKKLSTLAAKVESTVGTAESLTASEGAFNAYDIEIDGEIEIEERPAQGSFDNLAGTVGSQAGKLSFKTDIGWNGTTMPDWASVLLPACTYVESTQVYTPRSEAHGSNVKTLTMAVYQNGMRKLLAGCMGNFKITADAGKIIYVEWEFQGVWSTPTDVTLIAPTYPTDKPLRFATATLTFNSVAQCVQNFTFDAGNEVIMRECPDTAAGFKSALIVGRKPKITMNPEAQLVATEPRYTQWTGATEAALSCAFDGPVGGSTNGVVTVSAPKAQIVSVKGGDRDGMLIDEVEFMCNKNGATKDEDVSITFTDLT